ncbi:hypothetical protein ACWCWD_27015 [Streptomyces sp. NPDC001493]
MDRSEDGSGDGYGDAHGDDRTEDQVLAEAVKWMGIRSKPDGTLTGLRAKLLRKTVRELDLVVELPFDDAVRHVTGVLEEAGTPTEPAAAGGRRAVRVVAPGGSGGLNPVVVTALLTRGPGHRTKVGLRAVAVEGLINQRSAEKAAAGLAELLTGSGSGSGSR